MPQRGGNMPAQLPELDGLVGRSGGQAAPVWAKGHAVDVAPLAVPRQRGGSGAVAQPPELDTGVARSGGQGLT